MKTPLVLVGATALVGPNLEVTPDSAILLEDGRIASIGSKNEVDIPRETRVVDATGLTLAPGFIDAHVHIGFADPADVLRGGVTTVRDLGWPPDQIFPIAERAATTENGADIVAVGPMLTAPGGYPTNAAWAPPGTAAPVGSSEDAERVVTEAVERGAVAIKVALNPPVGPTLSAEILRAIVAAAHARDRKVTAHIYGLEELHKALDAGVDELAHMLMSDEQIPDATIERMVRERVAIVPTLSVREGSDLDGAIDNLRRFVAAGGLVVYGTDLGNAGPEPGIDPTEVAAMARAGMSAVDIVRSATVDSARWLGMADRGVLQEGARADIVGWSGDLTVGALSDPALVIRGSRIVRREF